MVSSSPVQHHGVAVPDRQKETERTQRTRKREAPCDIDHRSRRTERSCDFQRRVDMAELRIEGAVDISLQLRYASLPPPSSRSRSRFSLSLSLALSGVRALSPAPSRPVASLSARMGTHQVAPCMSKAVPRSTTYHRTLSPAWKRSTTAQRACACADAGRASRAGPETRRTRRRARARSTFAQARTADRRGPLTFMMSFCRLPYM